jgi:hypothetical protein
MEDHADTLEIYIFQVHSCQELHMYIISFTFMTTRCGKRLVVQLILGGCLASVLSHGHKHSLHQLLPFLLIYLRLQ